jgi:hypothetical protein
MLTFNLQAHNDNYYGGHEPGRGNGGSLWQSEPEKALCLTLQQARAICKIWRLRIVIAYDAVPTYPEGDGRFRQELFCAARAGSWSDYASAGPGVWDDYELISEDG